MEFQKVFGSLLTLHGESHSDPEPCSFRGPPPHLRLEAAQEHRIDVVLARERVHQQRRVLRSEPRDHDVGAGQHPAPPLGPVRTWADGMVE